MRQIISTFELVIQEDWAEAHGILLQENVVQFAFKYLATEAEKQELIEMIYIKTVSTTSYAEHKG